MGSAITGGAVRASVTTTRRRRTELAVEYDIFGSPDARKHCRLDDGLQFERVGVSRVG